MPFTPPIPTSVKGNIHPELLEMASDIRVKSAALVGTHAPQTINAVKKLLRVINSYYSNMIESEGTHPIHTEMAMRKLFLKRKKEHDLQVLSLAHISVQDRIERLIEENGGFSAFDVKFIKWVHGTLYSQEGMEPFLEIRHEDETLIMIPGELREHGVRVGSHVAPRFEDVPGLMHQYEGYYNRLMKESPDVRLIAALASHHRLSWIHPFLDGNGRTSRLVLDAAIMQSGIRGYGLWNISRALARDSEGYKKILAYADMAKQGATDGRGTLSSMALTHFVKYMAESALDQIEYMGNFLRMDELTQRIDRYVALSQSKMLRIDPLPRHSERVFKELLLKGEIGRGDEVQQATGLKRTAASSLVNELIARGYLEEGGTSRTVTLKIESHFAHHLFPGLTPEDMSKPAPWNIRRITINDTLLEDFASALNLDNVEIKLEDGEPIKIDKLEANGLKELFENLTTSKRIELPKPIGKDEVRRPLLRKPKPDDDDITPGG